LTVSLSNSPDADDAGFRVVTFDQVQSRLPPSGPLLDRRRRRTCCSSKRSSISLNAKAALVAVEEVFAEDRINLPLMDFSAAVGRGGETMISAQTIGAFWNAVRNHNPLSVGLNCSIGPDLMRPFLAELAGKANTFVSLLSQRRPAESAHAHRLRSRRRSRHGAASLGEFADSRTCCNIAGGCCGNTPEHIAAIAQALEQKPARKCTIVKPEMALSGSLPFTPVAGTYLMVGERTNVAGSPEVRQARQSRQLRGSRLRRPPAGGQRRQRHRRVHGRRPDRRRRRDDSLPAAHRAPSPRSPKSPSWSTPPSGKSSRPA